MKELYDKVCRDFSRHTTKQYSTSFSLGIYLLKPELRGAIYNIYGLVRFADEIVDTFHDFDKADLLKRFKEDCYRAIDEGISLNPILQSFQQVVNQYNIPRELTDSFFNSMEMDLHMSEHDDVSIDDYILGSAEVVGLMCLCVFVNGDREEYERLKYSAQRLGAAFQKVNFLRDLKYDSQSLGRVYFPQLIAGEWNEKCKAEIEADIRKDFDEALIGIKQLPKSSRLGVFLAYKYYRCLLHKIESRTPESVMNGRIRVSNRKKMQIMLGSYTAFNLGRV